jgi:polyisoprenoid-binding protein YceI
VRFTIGSGSKIVVSARSSIHDTRTVWDAVGGTVELDPADPAAGAQCELTVDMRRHDAGDFLRNRKVKKDLEVDRYPEARFRLEALDEVARTGEGRFTARARGTIEWHGRKVAVEARGEAELGAGLRATGRFELDVRDLGVAPPRFFVFKVEDVVAVEVTIAATAAG